jgi:HlyD family secretion protein
MNKRRLKLFIPLVVIVVVAAWSVAAYRNSGGALPQLNTVTADRGDVAQRIVAHGTLQPQHRVLVGSQVSGIIDAIHVDYNSRVTRGQVLARIDPSMFEAAVRSAQAELAAAEAAHELALLQWRRVQELREHLIVAAAELEEARTQLRQAEAQLSVRRQNLERARRELERCTIISPTDGIVIDRAVDVGQTVAASLSAPVLFEIASDLSLMQIHANVSEADIGRVREGQQVRFQVDAHRGRAFTGHVVQVRNAPLVVDNVVHYEAIIEVGNDEGLLKPGMTAEVNIITAEVQNAVRVRNTALRARLPDAIRPPDPQPADGYDGRVFVVQADGSLAAVAVRTGLSDGVYTEIIAGIDAGTELAVGLAVAGDDRASTRRSLFGGNQAQF